MALVAGRHSAPPTPTGTWRGTSLCVDRATDKACRDEQVVYRFGPSPTHPDSIAMAATKVIKGKEVPMGSIELGYDATTSEWAMEFTTSLRGRWAFRFAGDQMTGTLVERPSRLIRRVAARRSPP